MVSFRPLRIGLWDPFQTALFMAYTWGWSWPLTNWNDPPSGEYPRHPFSPPNGKNSQTSTVGDSGRFGMFPGGMFPGVCCPWKKTPHRGQSQVAPLRRCILQALPLQHQGHIWRMACKTGVTGRHVWREKGEPDFLGGFLISKAILYVGDSRFWNQFC